MHPLVERFRIEHLHFKCLGALHSQFCKENPNAR